MLAAALLTDRGILFTRPLWLDEYHTVLVANRATPVAIVRDLAHGADLAPPLLHLGVWTARQVAGALTPVRLHAISFVAVWLSVVLVYATLRRRVAALPSAAGALAVASHGLVVSHAFEARYYGVWLMGCAFFSWSLAIAASHERSTKRDVAVAVSSVIVCTIHWFGVLTLALMCAGAAAANVHRERTRSGASLAAAWRRTARLLAPAAAGLVILVACLPLLFEQRSLFTTPIWVPDLNRAQVFDMARVFYLTLVPALALLLVLASTFRDGPRVGDDAVRAVRLLGEPAIAALAALALMPVLITLVSWRIQPTMLPRYAIATSLAWAPLAALAALTLRRPQQLLWCALLAAVAWVGVREEAAGKRALADDVAADVRAFTEALPTALPVVFQARHVLYPVAAVHPELRRSMSLLILPDARLDSMFPAGSPVAAMGRFFRFERDAVRLHVRTYDFPRLVSPAALDTLPSFLLLARDASLPRGYKNVELFGRAVFPAYRVSRLRENLALFTR